MQKQGAFINSYHLQMSAAVFRINPWSYCNRNPVELLKEIQEQEQQLYREDCEPEEQVAKQY